MGPWSLRVNLQPSNSEVRLSEFPGARLLTNLVYPKPYTLNPKPYPPVARLRWMRA